MKYTTSRGVEVEILGIQTLWEKFNVAHPPPAVPTYSVKTAGGPTLQAPLTQAIVDQNDCTASEKAAWESYRQALAEFQVDLAEKEKRLVFLHGLRVEMPADDGWVAAQEELGIDVPADPVQRKLHWIETEVCGGAGDFLEIVRLSMTAGLPEEALRQAEALFRREVGSFAGRDGGNAPEGPAGPDGTVVGEPALSAGGSGAQGGTAAAEQVRRPARRRSG